MKNIALVIATAASIGAAYFVGTIYSNQRSTLRENLCLTNTTMVRNLEQDLGETTLQDLRRFGISDSRWERLRTQKVNTIYAFRDASPCPITVTIPPDIIPRGVK